MDFNDLYATRETIVEDAHNLAIAMNEFLEAQEAILGWLGERNLHPRRHSVSLPHLDSAVRIVITFDNGALVPFAAVEGAFWSFVRDLMPLDSDHAGTADDLIPFRSAEFRESDWDLVVVPDLHAEECRFPGNEFWEREAGNERLREEQRAGFIRRDRINEVLIGLAQHRTAA